MYGVKLMLRETIELKIRERERERERLRKVMLRTRRE